jgi:hypothetical protein
MSSHRPGISFPKTTNRRSTFHDQLRAAEEARARQSTPSIESIEMPPPAYQPARDSNLTVSEFYTLLNGSQSRGRARAPPRAPAPVSRAPVRLRRRCFTFNSQRRKSKSPSLSDLWSWVLWRYIA